MGITKSDFFTRRQNEKAQLMKALGHPARIAILEHLLKVNDCICGDLVKELPLSQATISQHLAALKDAGLIQGTIEGNRICYCVNPKCIDLICAYFNNIAKRLNRINQDCCKT